MYIRIIDNKKISMTNEEWQLYESIVKSYTNNNVNGKDLFIDLFETDENGIITLLKPPSKRYTSMEVLFFLMNLMNAQHIRLMHQEVKDFIEQAKKAINDK